MSISLIEKGQFYHKQDPNGFMVTVSPRYPSPIFLTGRYNESVERDLYSQSLDLNMGQVAIDVRFS